MTLNEIKDYKRRLIACMLATSLFGSYSIACKINNREVGISNCMIEDEDTAMMPESEYISEKVKENTKIITKVLNEISYDKLNYLNYNSGLYKETISSVDFSSLLEYDNTTIEGSLAIANGVRELLSKYTTREKYDYVLEHFKLDKVELNTILAVPNGEAKDGSYEDAFAVMTNIYDRGISKLKSGYTKSWLHLDRYVTMYDHVKAPGQYTPASGPYEPIDDISGTATLAALDCLCSADKVRMHNYLNYLASNRKDTYSVQFVPGGNNYSMWMEESDIIPLEERYYYVDETLEEESESILYLRNNQFYR